MPPCLSNSLTLKYNLDHCKLFKEYITKLKVSDFINIEIQVPSAEVPFLLKVYKDYRDDANSSPDIIIKTLRMNSVQGLPKKFKHPLWNAHGDYLIFRDKFGKSCWVNTTKIPFHVKLQKGFDEGDFVYNVLEPLFIILSFLKKDCTFIPFHGSAFITTSGKPVMVVGDSGLGKTSLLLYQILNENAIYASDELTFLDPEGMLLPYTREIYLYRRNFNDFPKLYTLLSDKRLQLRHLLTSYLFSFLDLLPNGRLIRKIRTNFKLNMCPTLIHPGALGKIATEKSQVQDILLLTREQDADKTPQTLLKESFIVFWFERYFFYLGTQLNDVNNGTDLMQRFFSSYSNSVNRMNPNIRFHKIFAKKADGLPELTTIINRVLHQID